MRETFRLTALILFFYSLILTYLTGNIGFWGDSWWVFSFGYWYRPFNAIYSAIENLQRPIENIYWTGLFEIFGAHSPLFHFFSLGIVLVSTLLMGAVLETTFPRQKIFVLLSMFFGFFIAPLAELTYILQTDNSRLQMIFFWASVLAFQVWAKRWQTLWLLLPPILLYVLATLTYESSTLLIFAVPLFVYPLWQQHENRPPRRFWLLLGGAIGMGFGIFLASRFLLFSGGAVGQRHLIPPPKLVADYLQNFFDLTFQSLTQLPTDIPTGLLVSGLMGCLGYWIFRTPYEKFPASWLIPVMGVVFFFLGILPYTLAGHGLTPRLYSSGVYGVVILTAYGLSRTRWLSFAAVLLIGLLVSYQATLRLDWQEAADQRESLFRSLLDQVPETQPNTVFLFLDLQSVVKPEIPIVEGVTGLQHQMQMLYNEPTLSGHFLYYADHPYIKSEGRTALVAQNGILARGRSESVPFDNVLIFVRDGDELILLDTLSQTYQGRELGIEWRDGITEIHSNPARILPDSGDLPAQIQKICCTWRP